MRAQLSFVLSQITCLADRHTDRQTDLIARPRLRSMQRGKNLKTLKKLKPKNLKT